MTSARGAFRSWDDGDDICPRFKFPWPPPAAGLGYNLLGLSGGEPLLQSTVEGLRSSGIPFAFLFTVTAENLVRRPGGQRVVTRPA